MPYLIVEIAYHFSSQPTKPRVSFEEEQPKMKDNIRDKKNEGMGVLTQPPYHPAGNFDLFALLHLVRFVT
jgi:hypothetical protein